MTRPDHPLPSLDDFVQDTPWQGDAPQAPLPSPIEGVVIEPLAVHSDKRGDLVVLLSQLHAPVDEIVHVYRVTARPGSIRAWVYHDHQSDRLTYTEGRFRVVLYDIRPGSPTRGQMQVIHAGADNPLRLTIPAHVVHGVMNEGEGDASFVNMPTRAYDPANPDKRRMPYPDARIPYRFED